MRLGFRCFSVRSSSLAMALGVKSSVFFADIQTFTRAVDVPSTPYVHAVTTEWLSHPEINDDTEILISVYYIENKHDSDIVTVANQSAHRPASYQVKFKLRNQKTINICAITGRFVQNAARSTKVDTLSYDMGPKCPVVPYLEYTLGHHIPRVEGLQSAALTVWVTTLLDSGNLALSELTPRYQSEPISLWLKRKYTDMTFVLKGTKELHAHKAVLMNASPVFEAMFRHDMQEQRDNVVRIPDISMEAMMEALRFMYTGMVQSNPLSLCKELVEVAERFQLQGLKDACERTLASAVKRSQDDTVALELMPLTHKYELAGLKARCELSILSAVTMKPDLDILKLAVETNSVNLRKVALTRLAARPLLHHEYAELKKVNHDLAVEMLLTRASVSSFPARKLSD